MSSLPSDGAPLAQEAGGTVTDSVELTVPNLGPSVESARLVAWSKEVGQSVAADEPICRLAVNQLEFEVCSTADGELTQLLAFPGDDVRSGDSLAEVATASTEPFYATEPLGSIADLPPEPEPEPALEPEPQPERIEPEPLVELAAEPDPVVELVTDPEPVVELTPEPEPVVEPEPKPEPEMDEPAGGPWPSADEGVDWAHWRSPVVRKLAEDNDVDLSGVEGTGIDGRVRKRDVLAHIEGLPDS